MLDRSVDLIFLSNLSFYFFLFSLSLFLPPASLNILASRTKTCLSQISIAKMPSIGFMALKARDDDVPFGFVREDNEIIPWRYSKVSSPASDRLSISLTNATASIHREMVHHGRRRSVDLGIPLDKLASSAIKNQKGPAAAEISQSEFCIVLCHRLHSSTNGSRIVLGQNSQTVSCRSTDQRMGPAGKQSNGWLLHKHRGSPTGI